MPKVPPLTENGVCISALAILYTAVTASQTCNHSVYTTLRFSADCISICPWNSRLCNHESSFQCNISFRAFCLFNQSPITGH